MMCLEPLGFTGLNSMNPKSKFVLSIVVLTVLLIGFSTGIFITAVYIAIEGVNTGRIVMLVVNLVLGTFVLIQMIRLNSQETKSRIAAVVKDYHEFIAYWSIPSDLWHRFLSAKLAFHISESNAYGFISAGLTTLIFVISAAASLTFLKLITIGVSMFLIVLVTVKQASIVSARRRYSKGILSDGAEVHFAKEVIIINGQLTMLNEFGYKLKSFDLIKKFDCDLLSFIIESGIGHRKNQHSYFIPIPEENKGEAQLLLEHYKKLVR